MNSIWAAYCFVAAFMHTTLMLREIIQPNESAYKSVLIVALLLVGSVVWASLGIDAVVKLIKQSFHKTFRVCFMCDKPATEGGQLCKQHNLKYKI